MRIRPMGAHALLLEVDDPAAWYADVSRRRAAGEVTLVDLVPGARTLLLDGVTDMAATTELVRSWPAPPPAPSAPDSLVEIPVDYGGDDLTAVAAVWKLSEAEAIETVARTEFTVAFCGFTPGFAYLTGLPSELAVPRLDTPRAKVPAGSVALADCYAGIYPTASPGGWRLIGSTDAVLLDPDRSPPVLLAPGTRVRLTVRSSPVGPA